MSELLKASKKYLLINQQAAKEFGTKPIVIDYIRCRYDNLHLDREGMMKRQSKKIQTHLTVLRGFNKKLHWYTSRKWRLNNSINVEPYVEALKFRFSIFLFLKKITDTQFNTLVHNTNAPNGLDGLQGA